MRDRKYLILASALTASLSILLPLSAQAAWPPGARAGYMKDCEAAAQTKVNAKQAEAHCTCGANVIEKKFSAAEINSLNNPNTAPPVALRQKLMKEVQVCKAQS